MQFLLSLMKSVLSMLFNVFAISFTGFNMVFKSVGYVFANFVKKIVEIDFARFLHATLSALMVSSAIDVWNIEIK